MDENYEKKRNLFVKSLLIRLQDINHDAFVVQLSEHDSYSFDKSIFVADWNNPKNDWLEKIISNYENIYQVATAFRDEIEICGSCGRGCYSTPGFYGDQLSYLWADECTVLCRDCFLDCMDIDFFIDEPKRALPVWALPAVTKNQFTLVQSGYESGFHPGQNDDPVNILSRMKKAFPNSVFVFVIDSTGQFDINFSVYKRDY